MLKEVLIFITATTNEEAKKIANRLLDQKKAACVNIIPKIDSCFWWQGKKESAKEVLLIVKSTASLLNNVIKLVKEMHTYELPEVIAIPIVGGNRDYLNWIREVTAVPESASSMTVLNRKSQSKQKMKGSKNVKRKNSSSFSP